MLTFGLLVPGEFRKLAQHLGFLLGLVFSGLPLPKKGSGTSCGAIALVLFAMVAKYHQESAPASEKAARRTKDIIENLRMWDIFTIPARTAKAVLIMICAGLLPLFAEWFIPSLGHTLVQLILFTLFIATVVLLMIVVLSAPSIFSNQPLWSGIFRDKIDWKAVFDSPVEVEVITTDCRTGKNRVYSTKDPVNQTPERMATILCESIRLPGTFQDRMLDGIAQVDAEISGNFPIERFCGKHEHYDVVFYVPYTTEGDWPKGETNFRADISRAISIMNYNHMRRKMKRFRRIMAKDRRLAERFHRPRRLPILSVIRTTEEVPPLVFSSFRTESMRSGIQQGERIFRENLPMIRHELGLDREER